MLLTLILDYELVGFVYAIAAIVGFKLLTGGTNLKGLIFTKDGSGQVSAARVQLLALTIATCIRYIGEVATTTKPALPEVDNTWLCLMGGSSGIYMARKAWTHLRSGKNQGRLRRWDGPLLERVVVLRQHRLRSPRPSTLQRRANLRNSPAPGLAAERETLK